MVLGAGDVELSWSTFVLEMVNFLVLVWILKRFLYKPILETIAARQAGIDKTLTDARAVQGEAAELKARYEGRLAEWELEREKARGALQTEIEAERGRKLEALRGTLELEREKARVLDERRRAEASHQLEDEALSLGARFTARLLTAIASPELEATLIGLAGTQLAELSGEQSTALREAYESQDGSARVVSAYPMSVAQRGSLEQALKAVLGGEVECKYEEDAGLVAGLRIVVGPWVLHANLRDELESFRESTLASA